MKSARIFYIVQRTRKFCFEDVLVVIMKKCKKDGAITFFFGKMTTFFGEDEEKSFWSSLVEVQGMQGM